MTPSRFAKHSPGHFFVLLPSEHPGSPAPSPFAPVPHHDFLRPPAIFKFKMGMRHRFRLLSYQEFYPAKFAARLVDERLQKLLQMPEKLDQTNTQRFVASRHVTERSAIPVVRYPVAHVAELHLFIQFTRPDQRFELNHCRHELWGMRHVSLSGIDEKAVVLTWNKVQFPGFSS
jgi:hypothetical protein